MRGELGQLVAKGQTLATIDERALAQQVAEAEAWIRQAKLQYERAQNLFERKAVTKAQLLDAVTNRDVAEARLASARAELDEANEDLKKSELLEERDAERLRLEQVAELETAHRAAS